MLTITWLKLYIQRTHMLKQSLSHLNFGRHFCVFPKISTPNGFEQTRCKKLQPQPQVTDWKQSSETEKKKLLMRQTKSSLSKCELITTPHINVLLCQSKTRGNADSANSESEPKYLKMTFTTQHADKKEIPPVTHLTIESIWKVAFAYH